MVPDPHTILLHATIAIRRGLEEYVESFRHSLPLDQLDHQINSLVSLNRGCELLAKAWLYKQDPAFVVSFRKSDEYLKVKSYITPGNYWANAHTITGIEAIQLIEALRPQIVLGGLKGLHSIRNHLEHCPVFEATHFTQKLESIPTSVLPELETLFKELMELDLEDVIASDLLRAVKACSGARAEERAFFSKVAQHRKLWDEMGSQIRDELQPFPDDYGDLERYELSKPCPVCRTPVTALYKEEADWDDQEPWVPVSVYGDVRCITCKSCHFWSDSTYGITRFVKGAVLGYSQLYPPDPP